MSKRTTSRIRRDQCLSRAARAAAAAAGRYQSEMLERRLLLSVAESEPNNTPAAANVVSVTAAAPTIVTGTMGYADDDFFRFTLSARSGVFFDIDSREAGISTALDTRIVLYANDGTTLIAQNDDGRDFDTLALAETSDTPLEFGDSALYADLAAGTYVMKVFSWSSAGAPVEPYQLKITANASFTSSIPVFNSIPGAAATLYLDFDGYSATDAWGTYTIPPFDLNGSGAEWTPGERAAIETTWRVVADAYAPFNINVSTSYGGAYNDRQAHRQIIGNADGSEIGHPGLLGIAWGDGFSLGGSSYKTGFTFGDNFFDTYTDAGISGEIVTNAIEMGNTSVHEIGHAMGLEHYLDEPHSHAFMYTPDFGLNRSRWSSGTNEIGAAQDDMNVIAGAANAFGYRADDYGNTRPAATVLSAAGGAYSASGVIHQTSDLDVFRFSGNGSTTITLDIPEHWGHLDGEITLYNAAGTVLATNDGVNKLGAAITYTLPAAGDYYVEVKSDAGEAEVGQYSLLINTTPVSAGGTISGRTFKDVNYNGVYETGLGDTILGSVTVYIDANGNAIFDAGEQNTTSSALDGTYSFTGLAAGTYDVKQVAPSGYVNTQVYSRVVTAAGETFA
ncbi:MAG: trimeric autotransporter adhesin, partial [Humisphaera sp.]|nr:trimeric autotransporter adhesin [Humisphaera sp.]